ncbi:MAG: hypothetical protein KBA60_13850 [Flavobacteriales bacterium]|nr:hypothetical protein [Flavobacteriales bacterium]
MSALHDRFAGRTLGVASLHGKERVIGPPLVSALSLEGFRAIEGVDTDRFGAFSGEVQRTLDPLSTAIAKAKHGAEVSGMDLIIASEGSFGPYPPSPFISCNEEFLVLLDARDGSTYEFRHLSLNTIFGGEQCSRLKEVEEFAQRMQFPSHGLVFRPSGKWNSGDRVEKGVQDVERMHALATSFISDNGSLWVETDMRAMMNPTRMQVIGETTEHFAKELAMTCPECEQFFFRITGTNAGLPCELCGWPTESIRSYLRTCATCAHSDHEARPDGKMTEEPQYCRNCNP